jgi:hypothetical protein
MKAGPGRPVGKAGRAVVASSGAAARPGLKSSILKTEIEQRGLSDVL